jgi:uncharacterized protein YbjT (DUF2867 family)
MQNKLAIVMLGATGAVGSAVAQALAGNEGVARLTLIGRRALDGFNGSVVEQHVADVFDPESYATWLSGHDVAICTLGVGQPSEVTKEEFVRVDKTAALDFAIACKAAGVGHFELFSSAFASPDASSHYLRTKGELEHALEALAFVRLSVFQPSMILTPKNRYGAGQAVMLAVWPMLSPLLIGSLRKLRGIRVDELGRAMAKNIFANASGVERLNWSEIKALVHA